MDDNKKLTEVIKVIAEKEICGKQFRVWGTPEKPLFRLTEVKDLLGYNGSRNQTYKLAKKLPDNEKIKLKIMIGNQSRYCTFITEGGFYRVIMKSDKLEAESFKDWVCDEVLPCIRKHGFYSKEQVRLDRILRMANIVENENYMIEGVR